MANGIYTGVLGLDSLAAAEAPVAAARTDAEAVDAAR